MGKENTVSSACPQWLGESIGEANIPTLACLLVQLTGDRGWIAGRFVPTRPRGLDDNDSGGLSDVVQQEIRTAAFEALQQWFAGRPLALADPEDQLLVDMMGISLGEQIPLRYASMIRHELGLVSVAGLSPNSDGKEALADSTAAASPLPEFRALIIGAGISGLCAAANLAAAGIPFTIVERNQNLGGVWYENKYPGAACDVPSYLYSFSFAPYDWSRFFAGSDEIHNYLEYVADHFDLRRHIQFGVEVNELQYDEQSEEWQAIVINAQGEAEVIHSSIVISAVGAFNKPKYPDVIGLERFQGQSAHTARWPEQGIELEGRRVVVVGNGASAMQVVPAIADKVASLTVVQRSPQWAAPFPKFKKPVPESLQKLLKAVPLFRLWYRLRLSWAFNDKLYDALQKDPDWPEMQLSINAINDSHRRGLTDYIVDELGASVDLLPEVLPNYPPFGKRLLLDNGWFRTLARDNVELITGAVTEVLADRLLLSDGSECEADVVIWATGFDVVNFLAPMTIRGRGGRELHDDWDGDDARAFLGTVVPGYPNFFCLYGPNTQFGHGGSLISIVERQMYYVMTLLEQMLDKGVAAVEVRKEVHDAYTREVDRKHENMIWTHPGMSTYYRNSKGRVVVCNPFRVIEFWDMTAKADLDDYRASTQGLQAAAEHSSPVAGRS
jgi:4-hydroxyacetophenone monooxygenase